MDEIEKIKSTYNTLLSRVKKAEQYLNNANPKQFEKWKVEFLKIVRELSALMNLYEMKTGKKMTSEQILQGFKGNL